MKKLVKCGIKSSNGQGMTEYIIIVALIAVSAIGVYGLFGKTIRNQVAGLAGEVAGTGSADSVKAAGDSAAKAASNANTDTSMKSYGAAPAAAPAPAAP